MAALFQRIATLILKDLRDELSAEERVELDAWVNDSAENRALYNELSDEDSLRTALSEFYESDENVWRKIEQGIAEEEQVPVRRIRPWRYVAAACVTILLAAGAFWWFDKGSETIIANTPTPSTVKLEDIKAPTGNNSTLTLGDGTVVNLDDAKNGAVAQENGSSISKNNSVLEYTSVANNNETPVLNTVQTSRGGQQQLRLPDGSRVWLNAQSSITYPTFFAGNQREIWLNGEAYFEIETIKNAEGKMPFIVHITSGSKDARGDVEVLGTHFNINAYDNESSVKTTLIEGKVRMSNHVTTNSQSVILNPGQQARLATTGKISVVKDEQAMEMAMAWTKNEFTFRASTIADILREACRWYPITVSFPKGEPDATFGGSISRDVSLAGLLKIFAESGISFKLEEGNKLIVTP